MKKKQKKNLSNRTASVLPFKTFFVKRKANQLYEKVEGIEKK